jgi:hypothetical protein
VKIGLAILAVMVVFICLLPNTPTEPTAVERAVSRIQADIEASNARGRIDKLSESPRIQKRTDKVCKKHPEWGDEACLKIAKGKTWVGMDIDELHESVGLPDHADVTDLGNGHMDAFLFYSGKLVHIEDGIVSSIGR